MVTARADLHNHLSTYGSVEKLVVPALKRAKKVLGADSASYGVLGLANLGRNIYEEFVAKTPPQIERQDFENAVFFPVYNTLVLKGQEVSTEKGHLLVLGLPQYKHLKAGRTIEETIQEARDISGTTTIIAVHPWDTFGIFARLFNEPRGIHHLDYILTLIDGIEVHNGESALLPHANTKAFRHYLKMSAEQKQRIGMIASSDGHSVWEIGSSWTNLDVKDISQMTDSNGLNIAIKKSIYATANCVDFYAENSRFGALMHVANMGIFLLGNKLNFIKE